MLFINLNGWKFMNMDIDKIKSDFGYEGVKKKKDHKRTVRYE